MQNALKKNKIILKNRNIKRSQMKTKYNKKKKKQKL